MCIRDRYKESADVVLLDVPCSGLGVIGRKKEIRYRVTKEDLAALVTLQKKIVDACWQYVKPGGILLYSTCTLDVSENEEMVRYVTEKYPFEEMCIRDSPMSSPADRDSVSVSQEHLP